MSEISINIGDRVVVRSPRIVSGQFRGVVNRIEYGDMVSIDFYPEDMTAQPLRWPGEVPIHGIRWHASEVFHDSQP